MWDRIFTELTYGIENLLWPVFCATSAPIENALPFQQNGAHAVEDMQGRYQMYAGSISHPATSCHGSPSKSTKQK